MVELSTVPCPFCETLCLIVQILFVFFLLLHTPVKKLQAERMQSIQNQATYRSYEQLTRAICLVISAIQMVIPSLQSENQVVFDNMRIGIIGGLAVSHYVGKARETGVCQVKRPYHSPQYANT